LFALINTEENQEIAASKAGMDPKTARKYRRDGRLPSEMPMAVHGRTRPDPFIEVWDDVQKLFEDNAGLEAKVDPTMLSPEAICCLVQWGFCPVPCCLLKGN
jgi:hypothetical protein